MATVLVTGVGSTGGTGTVQALREHTAHEVVGVDMDPTAEGFYLVDDHRVVPPASDERWATEMAGVVAEFDVDAVVPLVDEELACLPDLEAELPDDVGVVAPRHEVVEVALDKYRLSRRLADHGLAVPDTRLGADADAVEPDDFPMIVKPRWGRGSRGVQRLDARDELDDYLARTGRAHDELLLQRFVSGTEYTTSVVGTRDGRLLSVVPKEAMAKDGCTVRGVTRRAPPVAASCRRVFEALRPEGPTNVQQIHDEETGEVYTIEVNPRFSSTACLTVAAGVNELDLLIRDALGEPVREPDDFTADLHLVRYTDELYVPERNLSPYQRSPPSDDSA